VDDSESALELSDDSPWSHFRHTLLHSQSLLGLCTDLNNMFISDHDLNFAASASTSESTSSMTMLAYTSDENSYELLSQSLQQSHLHHIMGAVV
jgi:hypothetical protein